MTKIKISKDDISKASEQITKSGGGKEFIDIVIEIASIATSPLHESEERKAAYMVLDVMLKKLQNTMDIIGESFEVIG